MRNLQDYINKYNEIVNNLGYAGQGVDVLVQLLANASYIGEVENASYMQEASLEKASLVNSKIQHCMDMMYSVYRGQCPRVLLKIKPTQYLNLVPYQTNPLIESQTFKVFYSGYYAIRRKSDEFVEVTSNNRKSVEIIKNTDSIEFDINEKGERLYTSGSIINAPISLAPIISDDESYIIECLITPTAPIVYTKVISEQNNYYIQPDENDEDLSNDLCVKINGVIVPVTRIFAEHITYSDKVFDLTVPNFGSRIYVANYLNNSKSRADEVGITINTTIEALWYKYSRLSQYNQSELSRLRLSDADLVEFNPEYLIKKNYNNENNTLGLVFFKESERADTRTIHYKANRDRYVNSIIRSNSDVGTVLEENFPDKIVTGGTSYQFKTTNNDSESTLTIYYIPSTEQRIADVDIANFIKKCSAYYIITDGISIEPGTKYTAKFDIVLELYNNTNTNWSNEIENNLLKANYEKKFGIKFDEETLDYIRSLISKYSDIKRIASLSISYYDDHGNQLESADNINEELSYYEISANIVSVVTKMI